MKPKEEKQIIKVMFFIGALCFVLICLRFIFLLFDVVMWGLDTPAMFFDVKMLFGIMVIYAIIKYAIKLYFIPAIMFYREGNKIE